MTLIRINRDRIETTSVEFHPKVIFSSGSSTGVTGSVNLFARRSPAEKELRTKSKTLTFDDNLPALKLASIVDSANKEGSKQTDIMPSLSDYLVSVKSSSQPAKFFKTFDIKVVDPSSADYGSVVTGSMIKRQLIGTLFPRYRSAFPNMNFAFTNYNCLNFFTASNIPSDSALLYPNSSSTSHPLGFASGSYALTGGFCLEFYAKPSYTTRNDQESFNAGTIMHLSSSYALSLVTGSSRDVNGLSDGFRLLLQLSHSADLRPSRASNGPYPNDLVFLSNDNVIRLNKWHHCAVRWGGKHVNGGSGSFVIDGVEQGSFVVQSSSIGPRAFTMTGNPDILSIGNFYEGTNSGASAQHLFFSKNASIREGIINLQPSSSGDLPETYSFRHPLNAELHELRLHNRYLTIDKIVSGSTHGLVDRSNVLFYLPVLFSKRSPQRSLVLTTPFSSVSGSTIDPFNVFLCFSVGARDLSLENFTVDFSTGFFPRLLNLTSSVAAVESISRSPNETLYASGSVRKRNLSVLSCDNGKFRPNFELLLTGSLVTVPKSGSLLDKHVDDLGALDLSIVSLRNMVEESRMGPIVNKLSLLQGPTHEEPGLSSTHVLSRFQLTRESHSSFVSLFDVSNTMYGQSIDKGSLIVSDSSVSGSDDRMTLTIRDDCRGNLYRADSIPPHATWNSIGHVLYDEGLVAVLAPTLPFFGKERFKMTFRGVQAIHVMKIDAVAPAGMINSSSNESYRQVSASLRADKYEEKFVYVTGVNILDRNLNVVMRSSLAQPILKRHEDKFVYRLKYDF